MKRSNNYKIMMALIEFVAGIIFGCGSARADFVFGEPTNLPAHVANSSSPQDFGDDLCVSASGLSLFFGTARSGGQGDYDIWEAKRASLDSSWSTPVNLGGKVNSPADDTDPSISADGLSLFFRSHRSGGFSEGDLYVVTRGTTGSPWNEAVNLGPVVNSTGSDSDPSISADSLSLYFSTYNGPRPGGHGGDDIWVTRRASPSDPWGEPVNLASPINTSYNDFMPCISSDGLALFFNSSRPGGFNSSVPGIHNSDIYVSIRRSINDAWREPVNVGPLINKTNGSYGSYDPDVSSDGSTICFGAPFRRAGGKLYDFWKAPIVPIVDLNSDGFVDSIDMCIMVDHWGTDDSLCDIGPMPWGDGVVDVQDLIVLAEHLFEEVNDPPLIAHWPLDEAQGILAYDGVAHCDGVLFGDPVWQLDGGMVDGALQFDGIDDYVRLCQKSLF